MTFSDPEVAKYTTKERVDEAVPLLNTVSLYKDTEAKWKGDIPSYIERHILQIELALVEFEAFTKGQTDTSRKAIRSLGRLVDQLTSEELVCLEGRFFTNGSIQKPIHKSTEERRHDEYIEYLKGVVGVEECSKQHCFCSNEETKQVVKNILMYALENGFPAPRFKPKYGGAIVIAFGTDVIKVYNGLVVYGSMRAPFKERNSLKDLLEAVKADIGIEKKTRVAHIDLYMVSVCRCFFETITRYTSEDMKVAVYFVADGFTVYSSSEKVVVSVGEFELSSNEFYSVYALLQTALRLAFRYRAIEKQA